MEDCLDCFFYGICDGGTGVEEYCEYGLDEE